MPGWPCPTTAAALVFAIIVFGVAAFLSSILVPSNLSTSVSSRCQLELIVRPRFNSIIHPLARFVDIALFVSILTILCTTTMCVTCPFCTLGVLLTDSICRILPPSQLNAAQFIFWCSRTRALHVRIYTLSSSHVILTISTEHIHDGKSF